MIPKYFKRPCKRCEEFFQPVKRNQKICFDCNRQHPGFKKKTFAQLNKMEVKKHG